jgi:uncharacterized repeat protein (TIGR01451 family)
MPTVSADNLQKRVSEPFPRKGTVSMPRRLLTTIGFALLVVYGVRLALAQQAIFPCAMLSTTQDGLATLKGSVAHIIGPSDDPYRMALPPLTTRFIPYARQLSGPALEQNAQLPITIPLRMADAPALTSRAETAVLLEDEFTNERIADPCRTLREARQNEPPDSASCPPEICVLASLNPCASLDRVIELRTDGETAIAQAPGYATAPNSFGTFPTSSREFGGIGSEPDIPFVPTHDRLPIGRHAVGVCVEVQAPAIVNINQETKLKIVVRNTGSSDAMGVVVRDQLPEGLNFIGSQPPTEPIGQILIWKLGTLAAESQRVLTIRAKPTQVGSFDHAATVSIMAGGRATTLVQAPMLKVEQTVKRGKVLKGSQVQFHITVSNTGTGLARNVVVRAKLSRGLRHEQGDFIEQALDVVKPGEPIVLDPLIVEASAGGEQSCTVDAHSNDVTQASDEAHNTLTIDVVEPKLEMKLSGPAERFTDTVATYKLTLENSGTAVARNVRVFSSIPLGATVLSDSSNDPYDRKYDRLKRRLLWTISQLDPTAHVELSFSVRLGGSQLYQIAAEARSDVPPPLFLIAKDTCATNVTGMPDIELQISERRRVIDVDEETDYEIQIENHGSKEASKLFLTARLSDQLVVARTTGLSEGEHAGMSTDGHEVMIRFPSIPRLAPRSKLVLTIRAKAIKPGIATVRVTLIHDDLQNGGLETSVITRVTETAPTRASLLHKN